MEFSNATPFPAMAFEGVEPNGDRFHVMVLRQTLTWDAQGQLRWAAEQTPLCLEDECFPGAPPGCVAQESDLCHFKPRCDVIVNATAYAPTRSGSRPSSAAFPARLVVQQPGGHRLIDKTLQVSGTRQIERGWLRGWRWSKPRLVDAVPVRLDRAFGGTCLLDTRAASRVPASHRRPDGSAHQALQANPAGLGFMRAWYWRAVQRGTKRAQAHAAPQVMPLHHAPPGPLLKRMAEASAADIARTGPGSLQEELAALVAGFGVRPKGHPARAALAGTMDEAFVQSGLLLPPDFDFAVWNAAWPDQQIDFPDGDEHIALVNLCAPGAPGSTADRQGNTVLRLALTGQRALAVLRLTTGAIFHVPMHIDTLLLEPDASRLTLVWRRTFPIADDALLRAAEVHVLDAGPYRKLQEETAFWREVFTQELQAGARE